MANSLDRLDGNDPELDPPGAIETTVERRRSTRAPLTVRVSYATVDALFCEFTRNVNEGGMFIETDNPPPPETRVSVHFQLPGSEEPVRARGRVAWIQSAREDEPAGMGVEFEHLDRAAREHIDELVRTLRSRPVVEEDADAPAAAES